MAPGQSLVGGQEEGVVAGREGGGRGGGAAVPGGGGGRGPGHAQLEGRLGYLYLAGGVAAQAA